MVNLARQFPLLHHTDCGCDRQRPKHHHARCHSEGLFQPFAVADGDSHHIVSAGRDGHLDRLVQAEPLADLAVLGPGLDDVLAGFGCQNLHVHALAVYQVHLDRMGHFVNVLSFGQGVDLGGRGSIPP